MRVLVIAEHNTQKIHDATKSAIFAAQHIAAPIDLLVAGYNNTQVVESAAKLEGIAKVLNADAAYLEHILAENIAEVVLSIAQNYTHIFTPATSNGKNFLPRVAARLDVQQISDVIAVISPTTFKRPIYAGNAIATVESIDPIQVATIRTTAFGGELSETGSASIETIESQPQEPISFYKSDELNVSDQPELSTAKIIISGGRGLGSAENFSLLEPVANKLGAAIGASRAAVDANYAPNDLQVGQTGKVVAPELYIAVGISGAIQHLAGMKDSKVIVAINKDEDAPIFSVADYGLVADLFEALPEIEQAL